jgi:hypothetical protein
MATLCRAPRNRVGAAVKTWRCRDEAFHNAESGNADAVDGDYV